MNPNKDIILYNIEKEIVWEQSINFTHEISEPFSNNRTESKLRDLNNTSYYMINMLTGENIFPLEIELILKSINFYCITDE